VLPHAHLAADQILAGLSQVAVANVPDSALANQLLEALQQSAAAKVIRIKPHKHVLQGALVDETNLQGALVASTQLAADVDRATVVGGRASRKKVLQGARHITRLKGEV
jgi:hypothetical protein